MQGPRSPEKRGVLGGTPQCRGMRETTQMAIFQQPIEEMCASEEEIRDEVRRTVRHEIAHHFGIEDERLEELDRY